MAYGQRCKLIEAKRRVKVTREVKKVRARIAVLVSDAGTWASSDWSWRISEPDWGMMHDMLIDSDIEAESVRRVFVEVDLPVPEARDMTLQGTARAPQGGQP
jgi:hypothetical protein